MGAIYTGLIWLLKWVRYNTWQCVDSSIIHWAVWACFVSSNHLPKRLWAEFLVRRVISWRQHSGDQNFFIVSDHQRKGLFLHFLSKMPLVYSTRACTRIRTLPCHVPSRPYLHTKPGLKEFAAPTAELTGKFQSQYYIFRNKLLIQNSKAPHKKTTSLPIFYFSFQFYGGGIQINSFVILRPFSNHSPAI